MQMITKQKFAAIFAFLFVLGISADPIIHSFEEEDHHEEVHKYVDCQICESESFKSYNLFLNQEHALVTSIDINLELMESNEFSRVFSARAPPSF